MSLQKTDGDIISAIIGVMVGHRGLCMRQGQPSFFKYCFGSDWKYFREREISWLLLKEGVRNVSLFINVFLQLCHNLLCWDEDSFLFLLLFATISEKNLSLNYGIILRKLIVRV